MKNKDIRRFRFFRANFFTFRIILKYELLFLLRKFLPYFIYANILKKLNLSTSKKIRNYFFRLKGIYIKVGQFVSTVGNLFSPELTFYLKDLQDRVPPRNYKDILPIFLQEWGKTPCKMLDDFNPDSIASASLGQVYIGHYHGQKVAIKVLYPGIRKIIEKDLQILKSVLKMIDFFFKGVETTPLYNEFADMILKETDFNYEKLNIVRLQKIFKNQPDVFIPSYIKELSRGDILVTEFVDGCKIDNVEAILAGGHKPADVAQKLLNAYSQMIFKHGFFHSDPHPGNLILTKEGKIGIIDFGSADTISKESITIMRKLLRSFLFKDIPMTVQCLDDMGFLKPTADKEEIENTVYYVTQKLSAFEIKDYQRMTLNEIYKIYNLKSIGVKVKELIGELQIPKNYLFLGRTIGILLGVASKLDSNINVINILLPHLKRFLIERTDNLKSMVQEELKANFHYISQMPENIHKMLETVNSGRIRVNLKELKHDIRKIYRLGHQFIYTFFCITFASFSLVFHLNKETSNSILFGGISGFFGLLLIFSFMKNSKN